MRAAAATTPFAGDPPFSATHAAGSERTVQAESGAGASTQATRSWMSSFAIGATPRVGSNGIGMRHPTTTTAATQQASMEG